MEQGAPIEEDELIYRRFSVAANWYDGVNLSTLSPQVFGPHKENDKTGLSVWRAKIKSAQDAARGRGKYGFYVAVLRAGDVFKEGIRLILREELNEPGHCELPDLTSFNRKEKSSLELMERLKDLVIGVEGPFHVLVPLPSSGI